MFRYLFTSKSSHRFYPSHTTHSSSTSTPLCRSYLPPSCYFLTAFYSLTTNLVQKLFHPTKQLITNENLQQNYDKHLNKATSNLSTSSSSNDDLHDQLSFTVLDDYTKKTFNELTELVNKAKDSDLMVKPTTDKIKILWNGFQTTVHNNCNLKDMFVQLSQSGKLLTNQLQLKNSVKLDLVDFIPSGVLDEKTKDILRDLSKLGEKILSQFAKSTVHFQHPFLINLALLRLYVMQSEETIMQQVSTEGDQISEHFLSKSKYFLKYAADVYDDAVYISSEDILLNELYEEHRVGWTNVKIPRHIVFLDHLTQSIVVSIRGTASISDVLTDLHLDSIPFNIVTQADPEFENPESTSKYQQLKDAFRKAKEAILVLGKQTIGTEASAENSQQSEFRKASHIPDPQATLYAHNGMAQSAHALLPGVLAAIREGWSRRNGKYKNYEVVVTGHSLGGGTACLLSLLLSSHHNINVTTYAFAPPPVLNTYPIPPAILEKCKIHSFINHRDAIPRASHSEILNMLSILNAIDAMAWKAVDRTMLLMRGYLTNEERQLIKESIDKKSKNRVNYHGENDEIDMIVPGNIYLLRPKEADKLNFYPPTSPSSVSAISSEKSLQNQKEAPQSPKQSSKRGAPKNQHPIYQIHAVPKTNPLSLYNGFFYTGDSMVSDHLVTSYMTSMINIRTNHE